jgi:hypothetical protein
MATFGSLVFGAPSPSESTTVLDFMKRQRASDDVFKTRMTLVGVLMAIGTYVFVVMKHRTLIEKMDSDVGDGAALQARKFTGRKSSGLRIAFAIEFPSWTGTLGFNNRYTPYFVHIVATYHDEVSTAQLVRLVYELETAPAVITNRYETVPCKGRTDKLCTKQNLAYSGGDLHEASPNLFQQSLDRIFATKASWLERLTEGDFVPPPEPENPVMHVFKQAMPFINMAMMAAMFI